jgi:2-C-methyl-D-erythritol 4-phosphate cytidylyltransferase
VPLAGRPMAEWSIDAFRACEAVGSIVVAAPPGHGGELAGDDLSVVPGGATRAESVANALAAVDTALVAIHDAARPLVTPQLIDALVALLVAHPEAAGAIPATPLTNTVKRADRARPGTSGHLPVPETANCPLVVEETLNRAELWGAQTPQVFRTEVLRGALAAAEDGSAAATDEAMLIERAGGKVLIHPAGPENLKVTTPLDLRVAEMRLAERGSGRA